MIIKANNKQQRQQQQWIERLKQAQTVQENAFEQLEFAILKENTNRTSYNNNNYGSPSSKGSGSNNFRVDSREEVELGQKMSHLHIDDNNNNKIKSLPSIKGSQSSNPGNKKGRVLSGKK